MAKRTRYTPEFKAEVVLEALRGDGSQAELCRRHNLSEQQVSKWKQQVIENLASLFGSKDKASADACGPDGSPRTARWAVDRGIRH